MRLITMEEVQDEHVLKTQNMGISRLLNGFYMPNSGPIFWLF